MTVLLVKALIDAFTALFAVWTGFALSEYFNQE